MYIEGEIGTHIYDFISYEYQAMKNVEFVSLNSLGGNAQWALEIGRQLRSLNLITLVEGASYCLSACVTLFASGAQRQLAPSSELGVHGARFGANEVIGLNKFCGEHFSYPTEETWPPSDSSGCSSFLLETYNRAYEMTDRMFTFFQEGGVSESLREWYFSLGDGPIVDRGQLNILRKPDLFISSSKAIELGLATHLLEIKL